LNQWAVAIDEAACPSLSGIRLQEKGGENQPKLMQVVFYRWQMIEAAEND